MTVFLDGPASGVTLMLKRAPLFLRAVQNPAGTWDALDQLTDEPARDERIVAYRLIGHHRRVHVNRGRLGCGWFSGGDYRLIDPQPDDVVLRDRTQWRAWAQQQIEAGS